MRPLPYSEVSGRLKRAGFVIVHGRGSHVKFAKITGEGLRTATVPKHREIAVGTIRSILRQAGISQEEFEALK
jgi:predicted RNA binding protein YcfA (HicA-like mRNA interferase family)